jgi:hypothetical protein
MPAKPPNDAGDGNRPARARAKKCPICGKPATEASQPFVPSAAAMST